MTSEYNKALAENKRLKAELKYKSIQYKELREYYIDLFRSQGKKMNDLRDKIKELMVECPNHSKEKK